MSFPSLGESIDSPTHPLNDRPNPQGAADAPGDLLHELELDSDEESEMLAAEAENDANHFRRISQPEVLQKFTGHRNSRTMIKEAAWWGSDFILCGSDCGHVFGWRRSTGKLVLLLEADRHVVNCVRPHPAMPLLATSGIDYNVKLWAPVKERPEFDEKAAEELVKRNDIMLEATRDTITVPATLMIRMLASLNQIRRGEFAIKYCSRMNAQRSNVALIRPSFVRISRSFDPSCARTEEGTRRSRTR